ncbi:MAG: iron-containing alcohol dehydrogenase [Turicibacter sp.]|nr:iron-containing alcohol dehydrogenase [Turicibacter sp.]
MKDFVYDIPTKVYFGKNQLEGNLGREVANYGKRVLLCYGGGSIKDSGLYDKVLDELKASGLEVHELGGIEPNPRVESVREGAKICKSVNIDVLLAVGGGSVIDAVKFIGAAAHYDGDAWDLTIKAAPITGCLPIISILTLAATGSEMNFGGVISNLKTQEKLGGGHPSMRPKVSFLDPENTFSVSQYQTACGSVDILSHLLETYFIHEDMEMLTRIQEGIMKTVIKNAPVAYHNPKSYEARSNLMWASSWALNGFLGSQQSAAWTCHPIEHEISAFYDITHALGLAILTPRWMSYILDEKTVERFYRFATEVWGIEAASDPMAVAQRGIDATAAFFYETLGLTSTLSKLGITDEHFEAMATRITERSGDGKLNGFKPLGKEDIINILNMCL